MTLYPLSTPHPLSTYTTFYPLSARPANYSFRPLLNPIRALAWSGVLVDIAITVMGPAAGVVSVLLNFFSRAKYGEAQVWRPGTDANHMEN